MTKDEIIRKQKEYLFNCVTTYYKEPLVIAHAKQSPGALPAGKLQSAEPKRHVLRLRRNSRADRVRS